MSSNFDNEFNTENKNAPKKLDWIVLAGFVVFMFAMIGAVFGQNFRWLGAAFLIMPIVIGIGLVNNIVNMQPDWSKNEGEVDIHVPNAPASLSKATGTSSNKPKTKTQYWISITLFMVGALFFGGVGLFIIFFEFGG